MLARSIMQTVRWRRVLVDVRAHGGRQWQECFWEQSVSACQEIPGAA